MSTITLPNIRVSSDLTIRLKLKDGGVAIDWSTLQNIRVSLYADDQRSMASRCSVSIDEEDSTILVCQYAANKMQYLGVNRVIVQCKYMGEVKTYDKPAFNFVRWTSDQEGEQITIDDPDVDVEISVEDVSSSILQEAVDAAFSAADRANEAAEEAEHMVDIHTGPAGKSPYIGENGHWYEWDEETHQYVDTETNAKGDTGETPDISIGTVTTVEPGTPAAASMTGTPEAPVLNLSIPKGLVGATPNFTVGTVTTGEPGSSVIVTITGTPEAPVLNVTIPQGMQGNTGSSVDYPYELVNNLTTNDATKGLSAAQGYVLDGKVSQLEAKVDDLIEDLSDVVVEELATHGDGNFPHYGTYSNGAIFSIGGRIVRYKTFTEDTTVYYNIQVPSYSWILYGQGVGLAPSGVVIAASPSTSGNFTVPAGKTMYWVEYDPANSDYGTTGAGTSVIVKSVGGLKDFASKEDIDNAIAKPTLDIAELFARIQNGNKTSVLMFDSMQYVNLHYSTITSLGPFSVQSSTQNTITLSAADYACMPTSALVFKLAVEFSNGSYRFVCFKLSGSNTITQTVTEYDLTNATRIASMHDTLENGQGQHLSPFGYRALACSLADGVNGVGSFVNDNYIGGFVTSYCKANAYSDTKIFDLDNNVIAPVVRSANCTNYASITGGGSSDYTKGGLVENQSNNPRNYNNYITKLFEFIQQAEGAYVEIPFDFGERNGFLAIQGCCYKNSVYTGDATIEVYDETDTVIYSATLKELSTKHIVGIRKWKAFKVRITTQSSAPTATFLSSVCLYEMYEGMEYPDFNGKRVAFLGDSWTQFNNIATSKAFLGDSDPDCVSVGNYPNGESRGYTDACGLFPKYFAERTGAEIDNWGLSGSTAGLHGIPFVYKLLHEKVYDYIVVEFFINDANSGVSIDTWIANVKRICEVASLHGVRPIVLMPCCTNSNSQDYTLATYYQRMQLGL